MKKPQRECAVETCLKTATATTACLSEAVIIHFISSSVMTTLKSPYRSTNPGPQNHKLRQFQSIKLMRQIKKKEKS